MGKTSSSPKGRAGATHGRETGNACEIPNRTGKNNIINYGSLEPPLACHGVICLPGLTRRGRHCGRLARVAGAWTPPRAGSQRYPTPKGQPDRGASGKSSELRVVGRASCEDPASTGQPSTGSRLCSPPHPRPPPKEQPAAGSAVRAGQRHGAPGARVDRAGCTFADGVAGACRAVCNICARARGREGSGHTQDAHLDRLSSRARCEEREVKVKCRGGGCGGRAEPRSPRRALRPARVPQAPPCPLSFLPSRCVVTPWYYSCRAD